MEFLSRSALPPPRRLGILPGSFHPITRAHLALAQAALGRVDEVVLVMPRQFPHKGYDGVGLEDRLEMVRVAASTDQRLSVALTEGGLFVDIARECRPHYGYECELWFLCGRDAAERIVNWDYGAEGRFAEQLSEFGLLVAERQGRYEPPAAYRGRILALELEGDWNDLSASEIRERISAGQPWAHLVPEAVVAQVLRLYS